MTNTLHDKDFELSCDIKKTQVIYYITHIVLFYNEVEVVKLDNTCKLR